MKTCTTNSWALPLYEKSKFPSLKSRDSTLLFPVAIKIKAFSWIFSTVLLCQYLSTYSQAGFTSIGGAHAVSFARAGINNFGIEAAYFNQAGLSAVKKYAFDVSFEKRFNAKELSTLSIAFAYSILGGTIGLTASNFGVVEYNEQKLGFSYSRKLLPNLWAGGQLNLLRFNVYGLGNQLSPAIELGFISKLSSDLSIGGHIFAPGNAEIRNGFYKGTRIRMGITYSPSEKVLILAEVEKRVEKFPAYMVGLNYRIQETFSIRLGANPLLRLLGFGIVLSFQDQYRVVSALGINDLLGNSPAVSIQYIH